MIAFEKVLAELAEPLVDDVAKKIGSSDGAVHADETYWTVNGERTYYWLHATTHYIHFQFDPSRKGEVSRDVLGQDFTGTLVTDCYSGYHAHHAGAKQNRGRRGGLSARLRRPRLPVRPALVVSGLNCYGRTALKLRRPAKGDFA